MSASDRRWMECLVCPSCQALLLYESEHLICRFEHLAFPIQAGVPILRIEDAQPYPPTT